MNGASPSPPKAKQAPLSIDFLIIGGSISGLACALALRRVGHRVTVLERDQSVEGDGIPSGHRLCPNGAKILYEWGYRAELERICSRSDGFFMSVYETGERLGKRIWSAEVLKETRGHWMYPRHEDLRRLLHGAAMSLGAKIRYNSRVASVDPKNGTATLATGEVLRAHVIVGADGPHGVCRKHFPNADVFDGDPGIMRMYHTTIPRKALQRDPDLLQFLEPRNSVLYTYAWFGHGHCAVAHPVQREEVLALNVWVPKDGAHGTWSGPASKERLLASVGDIEPRLRKLIRLGTTPKSMPLTGYDDLEDWVHDSGRMVIIGQAAHPLHHGSLQGTSLSLEDGAVLAKLFSHLSSEDQIMSFLHAFQELRIPRCRATSVAELDNVTSMTLHRGKHHKAAGDILRKQNDAAGLNVLTADEDDEGTVNSQWWEQVKFMFGYDAEDEADNWWVQWGLLAMRAKGFDMRMHTSVSFQVDESSTIDPLRTKASKRYLQAA